MENNIKKRYTEIDLLEVIAIFLVVEYHCGSGYSFNILSDDSIWTYGRYLFRALLSPCVPLFFFANGYLLFNRDFDLRKHIIKILKLLSLTIIWTILKWIILTNINNDNMTFKDIFDVLGSGRHSYINSLWFLGELIGLYILFPLLKVVYDNNKKIFKFFTITCFAVTFGNVILNCLLTLISKVVLHSNTIYGSNYFSMFSPFNEYGWSIVYFCIGGCLCMKRDKLLSINRGVIKRNCCIVAVMCISCAGLLCHGIFYTKVGDRIYDIVWNGYNTIFTLVNVICLYLLCLNYKKDTKLIRVVSENTLGIYFVHEIYRYIGIKYMNLYGGGYNINTNIPVSILYSFIILTVSVFTVILLQRIPLIKKLFR